MPLYLQLVISFFVGGLAVALQSLIGERTTGFWRNLVITIPCTLALGLFFVGLIKTPADVVEVARVVPAALGPDYLFVIVFALLATFGLALALAGGFLTWGISAYAIINFPPETFFTSILYALPAIIMGYLGLSALPQFPHLKAFPINWKTILLRSLIGGIIIALVVLLSKIMGNIWGGLFSAFPATFSSTLIIYYTLQGKHVIPSVAKSFFFPGFLGFVVYAGVAAVSFPQFGIWIGTFLAYFAYATFSTAYFWTSKFVLQRTR